MAGHTTASPAFSELFRVFGRIGLLSFGGPAAQIALMEEELVHKTGWLDQQTYLRALSFCMLLPGPEAMQIATYSGWRLRGVGGGVLAGALFVLPGAAVILALSLIYAWFGDLPVMQAVFAGVQAAVLVIVLQALLRVAGKALQGRLHFGLAGLAFLALFAFAVPFPLVVLGAGLAGFFLSAQQEGDEGAMPGLPREAIRALPATVAIWGAVWAAPIALLWLSNATLLTDIALFFSKLAVVTFGGAYAVLAYMTQTVVETHGWLSAQEMIDALGLAETTPGPLILVTQFVGHLAGFKAGGVGLAVLAGVVTLWVTFVPCFLWIFAGAPFIEWISAQPRLRGALQAITAAVVGVILNLSVWFAFHVLFSQVSVVESGLLHVTLPHPDKLRLAPLALTLLAWGLLVWAKWPMARALLVMAIAGALAGVVGLL